MNFSPCFVAPPASFRSDSHVSTPACLIRTHLGVPGYGQGTPSSAWVTQPSPDPLINKCCTSLFGTDTLFQGRHLYRETSMSCYWWFSIRVFHFTVLPCAKLLVVDCQVVLPPKKIILEYWVEHSFSLLQASDTKNSPRWWICHCGPFLPWGDIFLVQEYQVSQNIELLSMIHVCLPI